jgi:hypothetical protein
MINDSALLRLVQPVIRDPWSLTAVQRLTVVNCVVRIVAFGEPRDQLAAMRLLLEMDKVNLEAEWRDREETVCAYRD